MFKFVEAELPPYKERTKEEQIKNKEEKLSKTLDEAVKDMADKLACLILTQPLHVCTVRAMSQFVGNESKYGNHPLALWCAA